MSSRTPSGRDSDADERRTYLVKPFAEVAAELDYRIAKGRELRAQLEHSVLPIPERLDELGTKYWDWHDYNATYLGRAFSTKELHRSYADPRIVRIGVTSAYADLLRDLGLDLMRDIGFLVSLRDRLRAYVAPAQP
jgi:hypothetical protein